MKKILFNVLTVTIPAFFILLLFLEFILFRLIIPASSYPLAFYDKRYNVMKFLPNQEGIHRKGKIKAHFRINSSGWNSVSDFNIERNKKIRIAIIGDSYVEASQVNIENAFPSVMEKIFLKKGYEVEVYPFGYSGAALSQYLQMARYVIFLYRPDILIFHIVHNDIHESIFEMKPVYYFLEFKETKDGKWVELPPRPYQVSEKRRLLYKSAIIRFLYFNLYLNERIPAIYSLFRKNEKRYEANVNLADIKDVERLNSITFHIFNEYIKLAKRYNTKIALIMDAPRAAIYSGSSPYKAEVYTLNKIVKENAKKLNIPFYDMTETFIEDYKKNHLRFEEAIDWHYNQYGHKIVANALSIFLLKLGWIK